VIPTGGSKRSGMGKDLGRQAYEPNLRFESVLVDFAPSAQVRARPALVRRRVLRPSAVRAEGWQLGVLIGPAKTTVSVL
jgi:hypothetical protein